MELAGCHISSRLIKRPYLKRIKVESDRSRQVMPSSGLWPLVVCGHVYPYRHVCIYHKPIQYTDEIKPI